MRFLTTFASIVLVCISFAMNGFGQKIEIKQDSIYYTKTEYENNLIVYRYKIIKNSQPYAIVEKQYGKFNLNYNKKHKTDFSGLVFKSLNNKELAYIETFSKEDNKTKEIIISDTTFILTFNTENNERLRYNITSAELMQTIANDLAAHNIVIEDRISRASLRKLFKFFNKDVTKSYSKGFVCGFGLPSPSRTIDLNTNLLVLDERKNRYCMFSISSLVNDSLTNSMKFYDEENNFVGEAKFKSVSNMPHKYWDGVKMVNSRILNFEFTSFDNETFEIAVYEEPYIPYYSAMDLQNTSGLDYWKTVKLNPDYTGCIFHPRIICQLIQIGADLGHRYYFRN